MKKLEAKSSFFRTEARVLIIKNDNDAVGVVSWLFEEADKRKRKLADMRNELDAIIYDEELDLNDEAKHALQNISSKLYNVIMSKE